MIEHPVILATQRTEQAKQLRKINGDVGVKFSGSKEYTIREDNMSNTITTIQKDNLLLEPQSCAIRTRTYAGKPAAIEIGGEVANALTSVQKDSMIAEPTMIQPNCFTGERKFTESDVTQCLASAKQRQMYIKEPTIQRVGNIYPSKGQGGQVVRSEGIAPAVCECHGEVTRVVEPKIVGYTRDCKGKVVGHHFKSESNTLNCGGGSTEQYVAEPRVVSVGNRNPSGHGIGGEVYASEGLSPTLCVNKDSGYTISESESLTQKSQNMEQKPMYRIRKLTPVETGRLMGMDDADIHKMLDPKDDKGKPIISKSQAYKLHGNSIVVDVLYHIFRKMFINTESTQPQQLTLF